MHSLINKPTVYLFFPFQWRNLQTEVRMVVISKKSWTVPLVTLSGSFQWKRQNKLAFLRDKYWYLVTCLQRSFSFYKELNLLQWWTIYVLKSKVLVRVVRKLTGENLWRPESCLAEFFNFKLGYFCYKYNGIAHFKNVNNDLNTNIYSYLRHLVVKSLVYIVHFFSTRVN